MFTGRFHTFRSVDKKKKLRHPVIYLKIIIKERELNANGDVIYYCQIKKKEILLMYECIDYKTRVLFSF